MGTYTTTQICGPTAPPVGKVTEYGGQLKWQEDETGVHSVTVSMMSSKDLRQIAKVAADLADELDDITDARIAAAETRVPA